MLTGGAGDESGRKPREVTVWFDNDDQTLASKKQRTQEGRIQQPQAGDKFEPQPKQDGATALPVNRPATQPFNQDGQRLEQLENKVAQLTEMLKQRADHQEQDKLVADTKTSLEQKLEQTERDIGQKLAAAVKAMEELVTEQAALMEKKRGEINNQVNKVAGEGEKVKEQFGNFSKELSAVEGRLQERLEELRETVSQQAVPDSFYAKTLGAVLGQNIEALQDGNFERLMGEHLNQFFQTGAARPESLQSLQELRTRVEGINDALRNVATQMTKLNPQVADDVRPHLQRVEALVTGVSDMQGQLQNRRATIDLGRVPVSMHVGARQTFLDELGRNIRRELDKFDKPENYFEGELERLITADLIAIVGICDKKVAVPPGARPELEKALEQLFEQAGLRPILPRQGEPFKTAEQDLISMAAKGGGQSLTVAQVVTRGFYYKHHDNETLLRKAGVTVYQ